jgi:hypothetical protein
MFEIFFFFEKYSLFIFEFNLNFEIYNILYIQHSVIYSRIMRVERSVLFFRLQSIFICIPQRFYCSVKKWPLVSKFPPLTGILRTYLPRTHILQLKVGSTAQVYWLFAAKCRSFCSAPVINVLYFSHTLF